MISLSNSTLNLFLECPRCFWLHFNKKITRPRGIFPTLPTGMDSVIKNYFNHYRNLGQLPPLIAGKVEGRLATVPLNLSFTDPGLDLKITGKLDECLVLQDGIYVPLDHKTRSSLPNDVKYSENYYQTQMDTYTLLLQKNGYSTRNQAYIVYYSPAIGELHKGVPFEVEVHSLLTSPDRAFQLFHSARLCLAGEIPDSHPDCEFCRWKKESSQY